MKRQRDSCRKLGKHSSTLPLDCAERKVVAARSPASRIALYIISPEPPRFRGRAEIGDSALQGDGPSA
ncbi:hypothetical protein Mapa_012396 [Marchantia paleacea]|nr:hypothetical protein Mapa_012396 [Marchantia paleacea]